MNTADTNVAPVTPRPTPTPMPMPSGSMAQVHFRVRCETLGHGEEVFLVQKGDDDHAQRRKIIPLYTTAATYPWYKTNRSLALSLATANATTNANANASASNDGTSFQYRYAIYRAGCFHRYEDARLDVEDTDETKTNRSDINNNNNTNTDMNTINYHQLPLRLLMHRETYIVNDVLGKTVGPPDIDHYRLLTLEEQQQQQQLSSQSQHHGSHSLPNNNNNHSNMTSTTTEGSTASVATLHSRNGSFGGSSVGNGVGVAPGNATGTNAGMDMDTGNGNGGGGPTGPTTGGGSGGHIRTASFGKTLTLPPDLTGGPVVANSGSYNHLQQQIGLRSATLTKVVVPSEKQDEDGNTNTNTGTDNQNRHNAATHAIAKKAVGFAPTPPPYNRASAATAAAAAQAKAAVQAVHLNSTDGLVVVSAFLPVVLHRNAQTGQWTADWDYEVLLSMQTHLRVTRIGVVKWRGWHGNTGSKGSPEAGVPMSERHLVEECLRPFHCVPVWMDSSLFGEMYNGFCKGVLWPVMHNVTSVYTAEVETNGSTNVMDTGMDSEQQQQSQQQFSEYTMDDFEQGPIHGGRGREKELWSAYNTVNRKFAEVVVQCFNEGDLVWIHGFHLLILPSYLTRRIPMAKVGIFLHTPFPSSEIFRTLWCREDLLRGMLNADQVGFHLFEYARHFLTCCRRLLGLNYGMIPDASGGHTLAIDTNGRHVAVTSIHAGIEPPVLDQILHHDSTIAEANNIRSRLPGKTVFCAIDRLESLKGIPLKLLALERFLKRCPEWIGKVVLIQIGISAPERENDYLRTRNEVTELVSRINAIWPGTIQFQECSEPSMKLQQRLALMRAADVAIVTPIRDGLNLTPLEYTIAHQDALSLNGKSDGRRRGLCILSEFASCTRVMRGALHVNPWKISEIANAIYQAVTMTDDERMRRISTACEFVTRVTTQRWALAVMLDLKGVHKSINPVQYSGAGLGLGYRLLGMDVGFVSLDFSAVAKSFKNSRTRLILVDYGGTITSNDNIDALSRFKMVKERKSHSLPSAEMLATLEELCSDRKNIVFLVSGKERHSLTRVFGHIPRLGLAAEHGMYISWPTARASTTRSSNALKPPKPTTANGYPRHWETLVPITDRSWRSLTTTIMEVYTSRTHGSYIEETEMKVLWQYRDADLEFGYLQARELEDHLSNCLRGFPVDILHGGMEEGGYVEVRPKGVNKGVLAMKVIQNVAAIARSPTERVDFCLTLGDDHCDEPMLSVMRQIGRRVQDSNRLKQGGDPLPDLPTTMQLVDVSSCDDYLDASLDVFTCTVGKKPSAAANYLQDVAEVQELFDALVKVSARDQKFYSSVDLRAYAQGLGNTSNHGKSGEDASLSAVANDTTMMTGMTKSLSLGQLNSSGVGTSMTTGPTNMFNNPLAPPLPVAFPAEERKVSGNLGEYLGTIEDDDGDDDAFFF